MNAFLGSLEPGGTKTVCAFPAVRRQTRERLASYVRSPSLEDGLVSYIVPPGLGDGSGIAGGFVLAARALEEKKEKT